MRSWFRRSATFVLAVGAVLATGLPAPAAADTGLFHRPGLFSPNLAKFTKWNDVVARADAQRQAPGAFCPRGPGARPCIADEWRALVAELRALPLRARVARVNEMLNRVPYVPAATNWHDPDHWETPYEFLAHGGQCEDYAIAKLMALAASGVPERDLRLVIVRDEYLALDHAIAVVYVAGEPLVLDNQIESVTPAAQIERYMPYYAINRLGWWYFGMTTAQR